MDRDTLIKRYLKFLKQYGLKSRDVVVGAGGALLLQGLRDQTGDIDVDVSSETFERLRAYAKGHHYFGEKDPVEVLEFPNDIDVHLWRGDEDTQHIRHVCCYSLKETLAQKQRLNRPKDQADIAAIKARIRQLDTLMLYHYAAEPHLTLMTRERQGLKTPDGVEPGYEQTMSFFFERPPLEELGTIFGKDHPVWYPGSVVYEHQVPISRLGDIAYTLTESPEKTTLYYDTSVSDSAYPKLLKEMELNHRYTGHTLEDLKQAISPNLNTVATAYRLLMTYPNFKEIKMKYAACVPHLMVKPKGGLVKVDTIERRVIGSAPVLQPKRSTRLGW